MRWIGREVKRFLKEAHIHLPFLLRVANAPPDLIGGMVDAPTDGECLFICSAHDASLTPAPFASGDGAFELEEDDELNVTEEELAAEEEEVPQMMAHAQMWDNFKAFVDAAEEPWAKPEDDTDDYRKMRAVRNFNLGRTTHHPPPPPPFTPPPLPPDPPTPCLQAPRSQTIATPSTRSSLHGSSTCSSSLPLGRYSSWATRADAVVTRVRRSGPR